MAMPGTSPASEWEGQVALVTGGAGGIGSAIARRLARRGARVVIADLDTRRGAELATEIDGMFVPTDVGSPADGQAAADTAVAEFGGLDVAVFSAAVPGRTRLDDFDPQRYREVMRINVDGVVYGLTACLEPLRARNGSALVIASIAGLSGSPDAFYSASKHAVLGLVRATAVAQRPLGVRVNALCPGLVDTPLLGPMRDPLLSAGLLLATADEVAVAAETVLADETGGRVWTVQAGRPAEPAPTISVPPVVRTSGR
jgi:NAD(P)-dependent dehydrogenase (short-subunit alcohol dehydrogenase family)